LKRRLQKTSVAIEGFCLVISVTGPRDDDDDYLFSVAVHSNSLRPLL
jgi:hypothetical protein